MWKYVLELFLVLLACLGVGSIIYHFSTETPDGLQKPGSPKGAIPKNTVAEADTYHFLSHGGRQRQYLLHVPTRQPAAPIPVVINFHAAQGTAIGQRIQSRMNAVADAHGFLVAYPEGVDGTFNVGSGYGMARAANVDDVGFTEALIQDLVQKFGANPDRVYLTGLGNGAMLCYHVASKLPYRIAAIAPVGGDLPLYGEVETHWAKSVPAFDLPPLAQVSFSFAQGIVAVPPPVPLIHFHGLKDSCVPFAGGIGVNDCQQVNHRSIQATIDRWVERNRCAPQAVETIEEQTFSRKRYAPRAGEKGAPVVLYTLPEWGHEWPGAMDLKSDWGTEPPPATVDASLRMWEFFASLSGRR